MKHIAVALALVCACSVHARSDTCQYLMDEVNRVEAEQRAGASAQRMDYLNERKRKLRNQQRENQC